MLCLYFCNYFEHDHVCVQCSNGHMLTHSSKKPFECPIPSCGRSYCDARSLRRHIDNYHARPLGAAAGFPLGVPTANVDGGMMALPVLTNNAEQMNCVSDDEESRHLAQIAAYE